MAIDKIANNFAPFKKIQAYEQVQNGKSQPQSGDGDTFGNVLVDAIKEVDSLQKDADMKIENMVLGKPGVTPHQAMIALEKADIAFQMMNMIRGKIVQAYQEVMRTQI